MGGQIPCLCCKLLGVPYLNLVATKRKHVYNKNLDMCRVIVYNNVSTVYMDK